MKFDDLDQKMHVFETTHDICVLPGIYMVARRDGRNELVAAREGIEPPTPWSSDVVVQT